MQNLGGSDSVEDFDTQSCSFRGEKYLRVEARRPKLPSGPISSRKRVPCSTSCSIAAYSVATEKKSVGRFACALLQYSLLVLALCGYKNSRCAHVKWEDESVTESVRVKELG